MASGDVGEVRIVFSPVDEYRFDGKAADDVRDGGGEVTLRNDAIG